MIKYWRCFLAWLQYPAFNTRDVSSSGQVLENVICIDTVLEILLSIDKYWRLLGGYLAAT